MMKTSVASIFFAAFFMTSAAWSQNQVDLGDLNVKGELLNDNRLRVNSREPASIDDRVKYRKEYRREILESDSSPASENKSSSKAGG